MDTNEDISELESMLYGRVHHDTSAPFETATSSTPVPFRQVSRTTIVNDSSLSTHQNGRYWSGATNYAVNPNRPARVNSRPTESVPIMGLSTTSTESNTAATSNQTSTAAPSSFKPLPTYSSLLSQIGLNVNSKKTEENTDQPGQSKLDDTVKSTVAKAASNKVKSQKNKRIRPPKSNAVNLIAPMNPFSRKIINPFSGAFKRAAKIETIKLKRIRGNRNRAKIGGAKNIDTIVLDDTDEDDNDEVVEIPVPPPPLVSLDSSDESTAPAQCDQFAMPSAIRSSRQDGGSRCVSPSSSIMSDDFIGLRERQRLDESLDDLQAAVEQELKRTAPVEEAKKTAAKSKIASRRKSYEVGENSFAAVDVYESESSDMPDSVYDRGIATQPVAVNSSQSDDERIDVVHRKKKLRKTRSSGSNKSSEYNTSDEDEVSDSNDENNSPATSLPFIVRGDAVGNNLHAGKTKRKKVRHLSENVSDQEFMSILSSMADSPNEELNESAETSVDTVGAIELVQHVIAKSTHKAGIAEADPPEERTSESAQKSTEVAEKMVEPLNSSDEDLLAVEWDVVDEISETGNDSTEVLVVEEPVPCVDVSSDSDHIELNVSKKRRKQEYKATSRRAALTPQNIRKDPAEFAWNEEMRRFYKLHWDGIDIDDVTRSMDPHPSKWQIAPEDRRTPKKVGRFNQICSNCNERGHSKIRCRYPPSKIVCWMCGQQGHREPRCPNTICLGCGAPSRVFGSSCGRCASLAHVTCTHCNVRGHKNISCPDKWRRYHSTTTPNVPLARDNIKPNPIKACCICASMNHYTDDCRNARRILDYPVQTTRIISYAQSYNHVSIDNSQERYVVLATAGGDDMEFDFNGTTKRSPLYRRFKDAVGLDEYLHKKRLKDERIIRRLADKKKTLQKAKKQRFSAASNKPVESNQGTVDESNVNVNSNAKLSKASSSKPREDFNNISTAEEPMLFVNPMNPEGPAKANFTELKRKAEMLKMQQKEVAAKLVRVTEKINKKIEPSTSKEVAIASPALAEDRTQPPEMKRKAEMLEMQQKEVAAKLVRVAEKEVAVASPALTEARTQPPEMKLGNVEEFLKNARKAFAASSAEQTPPAKDESSKNQSSPIEKNKKMFNKHFYEENQVSSSTTNDELPKPDNFRFNQIHANPTSSNISCQFVSSAQPIPTLNSVHDSDSNYSFSDFYDCNRPVIDDFPADFIPLSPPDGVERFKEVSEIDPVSIAKVYLAKENCRTLLTERGCEYRKSAAQRFNVQIYLQWTAVGTMLQIEGTQQAQTAFHADLKEFFKQIQDENDRLSVLRNVPKRRISMIRYLKTSLLQLDENRGNAHDLYVIATRNESLVSKQTKRARRELNMILFGQAGLADGKLHLAGIQDCLQKLVDITDANVPPKIRQTLNDHMDYIFSSIMHTNYGQALDAYNTMLKFNRVPKPNLNRSLIGFKINVDTTKLQATMTPPSVEASSSREEPATASSTQQNQNIPVSKEINNLLSKLARPLQQKSDLLARFKGASEPSEFWSQQCHVLVEDLFQYEYCTRTPSIVMKLKIIRSWAKNRQLSHNDYKMLQQLMQLIQSYDFTEDFSL